MLRNMTACKIFNRRIHNILFRIVIKCLNQRFINIDIKLPDFLMPLENSIRDKLNHVYPETAYILVYL